jgi:hypothetical protein
MLSPSAPFHVWEIGVRVGYSRERQLTTISVSKPAHPLSARAGRRSVLGVYLIGVCFRSRYWLPAGRTKSVALYPSLRSCRLRRVQLRVMGQGSPTSSARRLYTNRLKYPSPCCGAAVRQQTPVLRCFLHCSDLSRCAVR